MSSCENETPIIIGLAGKKHAGKSMLANVCKQNGFTILHFADALKSLVARGFHINLEQLESQKDQVRDWILSENVAQEIINTFHVPFTRFTFTSIRDALQYIGTDIIRKNNPRWHIEMLRQQMQSKSLVCIADVRFQNERNAIESMGGRVFYVLRPQPRRVNDPHPSENDLIASDSASDDVILNAADLTAVCAQWKNRLEAICTEIRNASHIKQHS